MKKWNLIFDLDRCNSCHNCVIATKDEYDTFTADSGGNSRRDSADLLRLRRHERGWGPLTDVSHYIETCNHCDDAPCINDRTTDAIYKRSDGIVVVDSDRSVGRKDLVGECPYGQIVWDEDRHLARNWTFDAHLLDDGWTEPRCAQACPTGAIETVRCDDAEMEHRIRNEGLRPVHKDLPFRTRIHYRNAAPLETFFLGGTVVKHDPEGSRDVAEGCEVTLANAAGVIGTTTVDWFGQFRFDGLIADGSYAVSARGVTLSVNVTDRSSQDIGTIVIDSA